MRALKEFSAGGVIIKEGQVLLVLMNTINGNKVWTYPKGHIESGEDAIKAAIREVFEETGYECKLIDDKEIYTSRYSFTREGNSVEKTVKWYIMEPISESKGIQTTDEIEKTAWFSYTKAKEKLFYPSDIEILELVREKLGGNNGI